MPPRLALVILAAMAALATVAVESRHFERVTSGTCSGDVLQAATVTSHVVCALLCGGANGSGFTVTVDGNCQLYAAMTVTGPISAEMTCYMDKVATSTTTTPSATTTPTSTAAPTTTSLVLTRKYFFTVAKTSDATFVNQQAVCAAENGLPGIIYTMDDYNYIKDNLAADIAYMGQYIPLYHPGFVWGEGPLTLPEDSPLRLNIMEYESSGGCYRVQNTMELLLLECSKDVSVGKVVLCYEY